MTTPANLLPDAFVGAAADYVKYRPPYPRALLNGLVEQSAMWPAAGLLDLACGPGRVALDLAASFETVWAVDLEPEMVEAGKQEAKRRGIDNVTWFVGKAEDLAAPSDTFELVTVGEAFHRLDQVLVAHKALDWLKPGGCLATLGAVSMLSGGRAWQTAVAEVAQRWMGRAFPGGWGLARADAQVGPEPYERELKAAGFADVTSRSFSQPRDWTLDEIVGYLKSTSVCSKKALGGDFPTFEAELRTVLSQRSESPSFHETLEWGYTLGRKPR